MQLTVRSPYLLRFLGFTVFADGAYTTMPLVVWWTTFVRSRKGQVFGIMSPTP